MVAAEECANCHQYIGNYYLDCQNCGVRLCVECPVITKDPTSRVALIMAKVATYQKDVRLTFDEFEQFVRDIYVVEFDYQPDDNTFRQNMQDIYNQVKQKSNFELKDKQKIVEIISHFFLVTRGEWNVNFTCNMCHLNIKVEYCHNSVDL